MTLSAELAQAFNRDGYVVARGVYAPAYLQDKVLPFIHERLPQIEDKAETLKVGEYPVEHALLKLLMPIIVSIKKTGILQAILGHDTLYVRSPPNIRYIRPDRPEMTTPPHQDGAVLAELPYFVTVWLPFVEVDQDRPGVVLYPELGFEGPLPHDIAGPNGRTHADAGTARPLALNMSPGDALIIHRFMAHGGLPNASGRTRISFDMRVFATTEKLPRFYVDLQTGQMHDRDNER